MVDPNAPDGDEAESDSPQPQVVPSPSDLLEHLLGITDLLERAWSAALDSSGAAVEARGEATEAWSAFTTEYLRRLEWIGSLDPRLGLGVIPETIPLDDDALSRLTLDPPVPEVRCRQISVAALYVFVDLVKALEALSRPSGARFDLFSGAAIETWWEAGAFALLRRRASALARIMRAEEECLAALAESREDVPPLPNPSLSGRAPWSDALRAASDLVTQGYCDAALPPLLRAVRLVTAMASGVDEGDLPEPLSPALARVAALGRLPRHVALLEAATERLAKGRAVDAGVAVPLAKELLARVQRLAAIPPPRRVWRPLTEHADG